MLQETFTFCVSAVTDDEFILFVKGKTGEGCSQRVEANWKKARMLVNATT